MILDFICLSSDDEYEDVQEERDAPGQGHLVKVVKVEVVDLCSDDEGTGEEEHAVHGQGHSVATEGMLEALLDVRGHGGDVAESTNSPGCSEKDGLGEECVADNSGQGCAADSVTAPQRLETMADDGQGSATHCATEPQRLETMADDGQDNATHCATAPQMQGYSAEGQSNVFHCRETPESNVSDDVQGDFAPCTPALQRMKSPVAHSGDNTDQGTNAYHSQDLLSVVTRQSGSSAEATTSSSGAEQETHRTTSILDLPPGPTAPPFPRQFWKAGDYILAAPTATDSVQNRMCVHPKFLHSNATSHKWVFGAIAELLDNAVDEIQNGATFVKIDKIKHAPDNEYSLMIQDDGGGMSPESLRRCMSFGFSHKCSSSSIGEYGNGLKTSTMRLGADVIVFTCKKYADNRISLSVGLLSYTFLMRKRCTDILLPAVDYKFDAFSSTLERIMNYGEKHFLANLTVLLEWSPFSTEEELFNQFRCMKFHGTKIVVFNLWFKDDGELELDFITNDEDIMISGAAPAGCGSELKQMHVANRFRYSLRVYLSILYLHLPENFRIILCGRVVEPHSVANDLIYRECIRYRPKVNDITEVEVVTTIGYLKGAPKLDVYGFNVYHKNRLILPFWPAGSYKQPRRGIAGVLETNFIKPTHDKQDFEKTEVFNRLEIRLKDMAMEYWRHHCHLVGYPPIAKRDPPSYYVSTTENNNENVAPRTATNIYNCNSRARASVHLHPCLSRDILQGPMHDGALLNRMDHDAHFRTSINVGTASRIPINAPQQSQTELCRRRNSASEIYWRAQKRQKIYEGQPVSGEQSVIVSENARLKSECSALEATVHQLTLKAEELRKELETYKRRRKELGDELQACVGKEASLHQLHSKASSGLLWSVTMEEAQSHFC